jgi:DNA polymerase III sliding clamp (beta) subunit (PCNA family)
LVLSENYLVINIFRPLPVSECVKFVSSDLDRHHLNGICFDFFNGGENCIHIAATDGRKLILLKQTASHKNFVSEDNRFIVLPAYLFVPKSEYNSVQLRLAGSFGQILISTDDYRFEGMFECVDGQFPNYPRIIPEVTEKYEWFTLCGASFREVIGLARVLSDWKDDVICLDAGNPESLAITLDQGKTEFKVEGTASRPMRVEFTWGNLSPCLSEGRSLTKFNLNGSGKAILAHEPENGKGHSLDTTKVFMPVLDRDRYTDCDDFCIPKPEAKEPEPGTASAEAAE